MMIDSPEAVRSFRKHKTEATLDFSPLCSPLLPITRTNLFASPLDLKDVIRERFSVDMLGDKESFFPLSRPSNDKEIPIKFTTNHQPSVADEVDSVVTPKASPSKSHQMEIENSNHDNKMPELDANAPLFASPPVREIGRSRSMYVDSSVEVIEPPSKSRRIYREDVDSANFFCQKISEERGILPHIEPSKDSLKRITSSTMVDVINGKFSQHFDKVYVLDCRFKYEFDGGHIRDAVNVSMVDDIEKMFLQNAILSKRTLLVFHCEFSSKRGPEMARHLRKRDRELNFAHYPNLFYPEVYILDSGYKQFFLEYKEYCTPENYVQMYDEHYAEQMRDELNRRRLLKRSKSLGDIAFMQRFGNRFGEQSE